MHSNQILYCAMYKRISVHVNFCKTVVHVDNEIYVYTMIKNVLTFFLSAFFEIKNKNRQKEKLEVC